MAQLLQLLVRGSEEGAGVSRSGVAVHPHLPLEPKKEPRTSQDRYSCFPSHSRGTLDNISESR